MQTHESNPIILTKEDLVNLMELDPNTTTSDILASALEGAKASNLIEWYDAVADGSYLVGLTLETCVKVLEAQGLVRGRWDENGMLISAKALHKKILN